MLIYFIEYILRTLQVKRITYTTYDLASDEDAKRLWRRKAPAGRREFITEFMWFRQHIQTSNNFLASSLVGSFPV